MMSLYINRYCYQHLIAVSFYWDQYSKINSGEIVSLAQLKSGERDVAVPGQETVGWRTRESSPVRTFVWSLV